MSSEVSIVPSHRLRALNGPLRGATFNVLGHITIGRSCDADLQILQDGVSRQHAQVVAMPDGRHRLIDLSSSNGTFVDDRRITECVLEPGMVLRVGWTRLVYESASGATEEIKLRRVGGEGLRTLQSLELHAAAEEQDPPESDAAGLDLLAPARSDRRGGDEHDRFMATLPDGSRYPGDLLDDVVTYRSLRTKKLRDDELEPEEEERFRALDDRMRPPPDRSGFRRYHRYGCRIPAFLRLLIGRTLPVVVENLGVDGAKVCVPWHRLATNTIAWLAIEPGPEHRVDHHPLKGRNRHRPVVNLGDALRQTVEIGLRIRTEAFAVREKDHPHVESGLGQVPRRDRPVATVVSLATNHGHRPPDRQLGRAAGQAAPRGFVDGWEHGPFKPVIDTGKITGTLAGSVIKEAWER